jgi:hypothetical protein
MIFSDTAFQIPDGTHAVWAGLVAAIPGGKVVRRAYASVTEIGQQCCISCHIGAWFDFWLASLVPADKEIARKRRLITIEQAKFSLRMF